MLLESVTLKVLGFMQQHVLLQSKCRNNSVLAPFSKICELTRAAVQEKLISLQTREKQLAIHAYSNCVINRQS